jgi:hypothetical protein
VLPRLNTGSVALKVKLTSEIRSPEGINLIRRGFFQLENHCREVCRKFQEFGTDSRRTDRFIIWLADNFSTIDKTALAKRIALESYLLNLGTS